MNLSTLKIVYFHSEEISIDSIVWGLMEMDLQVENPPIRVALHRYDEEMIDVISSYLEECDVVITQDFAISVAEACHRMNKIYISWIYDSPQRALYMAEALYDTNYVFCFDQRQVSRMKQLGLKQVFYCPLAANITKAALLHVSDADIQKYKGDISFVGSLYHKDYFDPLQARMPKEVRQNLETVINKLFLKWEKGLYLYDRFDAQMVRYIDQVANHEDFEKYNMSPRFMYENLILVPIVAYRERTAILQKLGEQFDTHLYTKNPESVHGLDSVRIHGAVDYDTDMFKVFFSSKINLNITMRGIETGIPQRVFDIMSVGGLVMSNYQEEAEILFEPDKEIILFHSLEELEDKAAYYLSHEKERLNIALNGYQKVKECYNYHVLLQYIFKMVFE